MLWSAVCYALCRLHTMHVAWSHCVSVLNAVCNDMEGVVWANTRLVLDCGSGRSGLGHVAVNKGSGSALSTHDFLCLWFVVCTCGAAPANQLTR